MKIVSLNCWGGKLYDPLTRFIQKRAEETDIFCFQEMIFGGPDKFFSYHNLCGQLSERIGKVLKGHSAFKMAVPGRSFFGTDSYKLDGNTEIGQAIFVKKQIAVFGNDLFLVYEPEKDPFQNNIRGNITGRCQHLEIEINDKKFVLINIHGLWQGRKDDTPERLEQSRKIIKFIRSKNEPTVLIGDFNLSPETRSIAMLGQNMRNLISEYKIKKTRSRFYVDMEKYKDYISDYAFISPEIALKKIQVLKDEVSDHLPLFLDFNLRS